MLSICSPLHSQAPWPKTLETLTDESFTEIKASTLHKDISIMQREDIDQSKRVLGILKRDLNQDGTKEILIEHDLGAGGGAYYSIYQQRGDKLTAIAELQGSEIAILAPFNHFAQIELWSGSGVEYEIRLLMRYIRGRYRCVRVDRFKIDGDTRRYLETETIDQSDKGERDNPATWEIN